MCAQTCVGVHDVRELFVEECDELVQVLVLHRDVRTRSLRDAGSGSRRILILILVG